MFQTVDTDFSPGDVVYYFSAGSYSITFQTVDTDFSPGDYGLSVMSPISRGSGFRPLTRISLLVTMVNLNKKILDGEVSDR